MNELALLIAFLTSVPSFQTACAQTQDNGHSGYAVDSIAFATESPALGTHVAGFSIKRRIYADDQCTGAVVYEKAESGRVAFAKSASGFFSSNDGEERFDADWITQSGGTEKKELGSIGVHPAKGEVRIARNTPGFMRNSMLQLIPFKAKK